MATLRRELRVAHAEANDADLGGRLQPDADDAHEGGVIHDRVLALVRMDHHHLTALEEDVPITSRAAVFEIDARGATVFTDRGDDALAVIGGHAERVAMTGDALEQGGDDNGNRQHGDLQRRG